MSLKGNLNNFDLIGFFQELTSANKEGTFITAEGNDRRVLHCREGKVSLLVSSKYPELTLGDLLVKSGRLTEKQLQKALQRQQELALLKKQEPSEQKIEEILIELGYIKPEEIEQPIRSIISEEIYELFAWDIVAPPESERKIEFEFTEGPVPSGLTYPVNSVTSLALDIKSVIKEAKDRREEWSDIKATIVHHGIIFALTELGASVAHQDLTTRKILPLINGIRTIENIVAESGLPRFKIYQTLHTLNSRELIREVTLQELKTNGRQLIKEGKHEQALSLYQQAHRTNPSDIPVLENLAEILVLMNKNKEAAQAYEQLAKLLLARDKGDLAIIAYQKAIGYQPENIVFHQALFDLLKVRQATQEAIKSGQELLKLHAAQHNFDEIVRLAVELMEIASPEEILELINNLENPGQVYEQLAKSLLEKDKNDLAIAAYQKAIQFQPESIDLHQALFDLLKTRQATPEAIQSGRELLKLHAAKNDLEATINLTEELMDLESPTEILELIANLENAGQLYEQLGQRLLEKNKGDLAIIAYQKAIQSQPQNINYHLTLFNLLKVKEAIPEAFKYGQNLLKLYAAEHNRNEAVNLAGELMGLGSPEEVLTLIANLEEAEKLYEQIGQLLSERDKTDLAILTYQKAIQHQPALEEAVQPGDVAESPGESAQKALLEKNINLYQRLYNLLKIQQSIPEMLKYGKELLKLYATNQQLTDASNLAEELRGLGPLDFELRAYIAKVYFDMGEYKKSRQEINQAIATIPSNKVRDLIKAYEEILKIEPKQSDARYHLDLLLKGQARKKRRRLIFTGIAAAALVLAGLITSAIYTDYGDYQRFKQLQSRTQPLETEEQYSLVLEQYESFKTTLPLYTWLVRKRETQRLQTELKALQRQNRLSGIEDQTQLQAAYRTAQELEEKSTSYLQPRELYQKILTESQEKHFDELAAQAGERIEVINQYLKEAQAHYEKASQLDKQNRIEEARQLLIKLINDYPKSDLVHNVKSPVKIESIPQGAQVYLNNRLMGKTPLKAHVPLRETTQLVLKYPKFRTYEKSIKGYEQALIKIILEKYPVWTYLTKGIIEASPVIYRDTLYAGSRDGNLYALSIKSGRLLWKFTTDSASDIITTPVLDPVNGRCFILSNDNDLYIVSLTTGSKIRKIQLTALVKNAPTISPYGERIFLGSNDKNIYCLKADSGNLIWKFATEGKIRAGSTLVRQTLYTPSEDGTLYVLNSQTGNLLWKLQLGGELVTQPLIHNNMCYVGSSNSNLYAINLSDHSIKWRYQAKASISGAVSDKEMILATSRDGTCYALDNKSGKLRWKFQTRGSINGAPAIYAQNVYLASTDGVLYAVSSKGEELWHYKTGGKILSSPIVSKQFVFTGSSDRNIYAIER